MYMWLYWTGMTVKLQKVYFLNLFQFTPFDCKIVYAVFQSDIICGLMWKFNTGLRLIGVLREFSNKFMWILWDVFLCCYLHETQRCVTTGTFTPINSRVLGWGIFIYFRKSTAYKIIINISTISLHWGHLQVFYNDKLLLLPRRFWHIATSMVSKRLKI